MPNPPDKKLLYVINHMDWFWSHRLPLARGAQKQGWEMYVAAMGAENDTRLDENRFKGLNLPPAQRLSALRTLWRLHQYMKEVRPAIVHAITLKYAFLTGLAGRFHKNIRMVHTFAGLGYLFYGEGLKARMLRLCLGPFLKLAFKRPFATIIFQNPDDMALMIRRGFVRESQCVLIRGSGVDMEEFQFAPEPENDPPLVVMPTRMVREKGVAVFIEAAKILKTRSVNARFMIAGGFSTSNPNALTKKEMEDILKGSPVDWPGHVEDMPALLRSANLVVYPSWYGEGVPKVLLEAAATGRAIVTTDHPGCREAVRHEENGLLVSIKNPQAAADAVQKLLENKNLRHSMGKAGHEYAAQQFDVKKVVAETLKLYET